MVENNKFTCSETTTEIVENKWYKVNGNSINITYPEEDNDIENNIERLKRLFNKKD